MPELEFHSLRNEVEAATRLPQFTDVQRRARGVRLRDRLATGGALLATLAVFAPVSVAALHTRGSEPSMLSFDPSFVPITPSSQPLTPESAGPSGEVRPMTVTVRAVAALDEERTFGAVDVCVGATAARRCSLQISQLSDGPGSRQPVAVGLLRQQPTDILTGVRLDAVSARSVLVSGVVAGKPRAAVRVSLLDGLTTVPTVPDEPLETNAGDKLIQLDDFGHPYAVRRADDSLSRLPTLPDLDKPSVVTSIAPEHGWWVTGLDSSGSVAVAVSRDRGVTWQTRPLGLPAGLDTPTLATEDGSTVYAFVRTTKQVQQLRSEDGGETWQPMGASMPWPGALAAPGGLTGRGFGAIVRPSGSVLLWIEDATAPVFLESTDRGRTYHGTTGPAGAILPVPGGYVALGAKPARSRDALTWSALPPPAYNVPN